MATDKTSAKKALSKPTETSTSESTGTRAFNNSRHVGWVFVIAAFAMVAIVILVGFDQRYWFLPPEQKLISSWRADLQLIKDNKQAAAFLPRVKEVRLRANDHSPAAEWIEKIQAPLEKNNSGDVLADVFLIHQIVGHRYGVIVQYEFIETKTGNKIGEFARTLWLGVYY